MPKQKYPRICVTCQHCSFSGYEPDLSDITFGSDLAMSCGLPLTKTDSLGRKRIVKHSRWDINDAVSLADVREMLLTAQDCPDYKLYEEPTRND